MADWSLVGDGQRFATFGVGGITNGGADLGATTNTLTTVGCRGTLLTVGLLANTKSAWTTIVDAAALTFDAAGFFFHVPYTNVNKVILFDIGIGATPTVLVSNIIIDVPRANQAGRSSYWPLMVPKGTQVSARHQIGNNQNTNTDVAITFVGTGFDPSPPFGVCNTYGVTIATSTAADINPFGAPNTANSPSVKGPYTILGTTTAPVSAIMFDFSEHLQLSAISTRWAVDLAIGAPGVEQVIIANLPVEINAQGDQYGQNFVGPIPCHIPSGVAVSARCATACNTARPHNCTSR